MLWPVGPAAASPAPNGLDRHGITPERGVILLRFAYEQALVCLSNREVVDASRGCTFHCKMACNCLLTVVFSNWFGLIYLAI